MATKGAGADNIRNVTGTPTAGIDPQELLDTRPYAREWHHRILNDRGLYGLPRKFNVAFDGAGIIPVLEDTNDIGFQAVEVLDGSDVEPGVWFRLALGGITGHKDFARDTGVIVKPADAGKVADAIVRVFIDQGDRTNRLKARLKYVLDAWGFEKYLAAVEEKLGREAGARAGQAKSSRDCLSIGSRISASTNRSRRACTGSASSCRSERSPPIKCAGVAKISNELGDGDIRLTVWQNLLISGDSDRKNRAGGSGDRSARPYDQGELNPRRSRLLHRQHGLPFLCVRHQGSRRADRPALRSKGVDRLPREHSPDRLPSLLCAALRQRNRAARRAR